MARRRRTSLRSIIVLSLLTIFLGIAFFARPEQFHPYVSFQVASALQISVLKESQPDRGQCQATVLRVAQAVQENCGTCRLMENRCLDKLDTRQRKILYGQPVDIPVMRIPGGAVAFIGTVPELALLTCQESERQAARVLPSRTQCASASLENKALSLANISEQSSARVVPGSQALLGILVVAALIAFLVCYLIIRSEQLHGLFSHDSDTSGPQKFHALPTPRIGGLALAAALAGSILVIGAVDWLKPPAVAGLALVGLAAIPAFAGGFGEDVTKRIGVLARLLLTIAAGAIASLAVGATLDRLDLPGLDFLLQWPIFAILFTAFAVGGMANAINIIDGYNGLVGGYGVLVLAALTVISLQVGDPVVLSASVAMAGALLGFLVWNFPKGRIFLGDGGAYLLGFWLAELSVLLVSRNPDVSPWFPMALLAYPVFETFFSIYRKKFLRGHSPGHPDGLHLHMLIYKRLARVAVGSKEPQEMTFRNSMVAPYVWAGSALFIVPALLFWRNTPVLMALVLASCCGYVWLYLRLTRWRAPSWLIVSRTPRVSSSRGSS